MLRYPFATPTETHLWFHYSFSYMCACTALITALTTDYIHCGLVHKEQMGNRLGSPHQRCPPLSDFHPGALPLTSSNPISRLPNNTIRLSFLALVLVPQPGWLGSCRVLYPHIRKWKARRGPTENT